MGTDVCLFFPLVVDSLSYGEDACCLHRSNLRDILDGDWVLLFSLASSGCIA
jgi:hypothetical protein